MVYSFQANNCPRYRHNPHPVFIRKKYINVHLLFKKRLYVVDWKWDFYAISNHPLLFLKTLEVGIRIMQIWSECIRNVPEDPNLGHVAT